MALFDLFLTKNGRTKKGSFAAVCKEPFFLDLKSNPSEPCPMIRILPNQTSPDQNPAESNLIRSESYQIKPYPIRILPNYASPDQDLQVFVHGGDACNAEVVYQNLRHIRGQEGRKCRSQMDVFDSEVEES